MRLRTSLSARPMKYDASLSLINNHSNLTTSVGQLREMSIVVADDDATHAAGLKSMLLEAGYQDISIVARADALTRRLRQSDQNGHSPVDLVLMGGSLAGVDIYEWGERISISLYSERVAFVFVLESAPQQRPEALRRAYSVGALDVLFAPAGALDLIPRVTLALTIQRERRLRRAREASLETELAERKVVEARLSHLAVHDDLTGLANRRQLHQALALAIFRSHKFQRINALLYLDIDQFKHVNDNEGHEVGDQVLIEIAQALRNQLTAGELLARIAGDEFAVLIENTSEDLAMARAEALRAEVVRLKIRACRGCYHPSISIGAALMLPNEELTATEMVARAHQACYLAKSQGRDSVHRFDDGDMELQAMRRDAKWLPRIRGALEANGLFLVYQPIMQLPERRISHYEALVRIRTAEGTIWTPKDFIPTAERMGLIHQIDLWVVEHAVDFLASLPPERGFPGVSVNLSSHAFQSKNLLPLVEQKLASTWITASRLTFEITETAAIMNFRATRNMVAQLRDLGCGFCLDDFGSGFSSFSYIKNFPVDSLKIDGAFIVNILTDHTDRQLVKAMIDIGHSLGKKVTAEYVANERVLSLLANLGVDYVQGNYIGAAAADLPAVPCLQVSESRC